MCCGRQACGVLCFAGRRRWVALFVGAQFVVCACDAPACGLCTGSVLLQLQAAGVAALRHLWRVVAFLRRLCGQIGPVTRQDAEAFCGGVPHFWRVGGSLMPAASAVQGLSWCSGDRFPEYPCSARWNAGLGQQRMAARGHVVWPGQGSLLAVFGLILQRLGAWVCKRRQRRRNLSIRSNTLLRRNLMQGSRLPF